MLPWSALDNKLHHYFIPSPCENYDRCIPCNFSNLSNHGCASRTLFCNYRVDVYIEVIDREIQNERKWKQNKNLLSNCSLTFNCLVGGKKRQEMLSVPTNTTSQHLRIRSQYWKKSLNGKYEEGESCEIHYSPWDLQVCLWHFACVCVSVSVYMSGVQKSRSACDKVHTCLKSPTILNSISSSENEWMSLAREWILNTEWHVIVFINQ